MHDGAREPHPTLADVAELSADMADGLVSSELLVELYLDRINAIDRAGPTLGSVLCVNPNALADARERDAERERGELRGALHGIPVLLKDQVETSDMPTSYGSVLFEGFVPERDATIVLKLKNAGAIILAKTTMGEFASRYVGSAFGVIRNAYDQIGRAHV